MFLLDREMLTDTNSHRIMIIIGLVWSVMWQSHWQVVMEQRPWSSEMCMATTRRKRFMWSMNEPEEDEKEDDGSMPMITIFSADGKVGYSRSFRV